MNYSERIKELRKEMRLSQKQLADEIGISQSVLCDYENNKSEPTVSVILKLSTFFDVSTDYLLGRKDW